MYIFMNYATSKCWNTFASLFFTHLYKVIAFEGTTCIDVNFMLAKKVFVIISIEQVQQQHCCDRCSGNAKKSVPKWTSDCKKTAFMSVCGFCPRRWAFWSNIRIKRLKMMNSKKQAKCLLHQNLSWYDNITYDT